MKILILAFIALLSFNTIANDCECRDIDQLTEQLMASYDIDRSSILEYQEMMDVYQFLKSDIEKLSKDYTFMDVIAEDIVPLAVFLFVHYKGRLPKSEDLNTIFQLSLRGLIDTSVSMTKKELRTVLNAIYCNIQ